MEFIKNTLDARNEIEACIKKNGFAPEHNFGYYQWLQEPGKENVFLKFPNKSGILAQHNEKLKTWYFVSLPVTGKAAGIKLLADAIDSILSDNAKKINLEITPQLKKHLAMALKGSNFRIGRNNYVYYWPVFDMKSWDGYGLKGKKWKKLRNIRNRFYKLNNVDAKESREISKQKLEKIVKDWIKKRSGIDRPMYERYLNMIRQDFDGVDFARSLIVNGEPCSITAGWRIPNSNDYYSAVGIYTNKFAGIGEAANLDDLFFLKKKKFENVDFGGSGKTLLQFKKKFKPSSIYETYSFPVFRK